MHNLLNRMSIHKDAVNQNFVEIRANKESIFKVFSTKCSNK
jgi:hypothetical protein